MSLIMFMYHRVLPEEHREAVSCDMFRRQLEYISENFKVLSPAGVFSYIRGGYEEKDGDFAAFSFDDGWLDNLLYAAPEMQKFGYSAMLAVSAGYRSGNACVRTGESEKVLTASMADAQKNAASGDTSAYMNDSELKAISEKYGWSLEAHGTVHRTGAAGASMLSFPQSGEAPDEFKAFLKNDLAVCREYIEGISGRAPEAFFWPWGHYSLPAVKYAAEAGFDIQFTVAKGYISCGDKRTVLPRIGVSPRWKKFRRNCFIFKHPALAAAHNLFSHRLKVEYP